MKYQYLNVNPNCKTCDGGGMAKWSGNDCPKCLKEIDITDLNNYQLKQLKKIDDDTIKLKAKK